MRKQRGRNFSKEVENWTELRPKFEVGAIDTDPTVLDYRPSRSLYMSGPRILR